MVMGLVWMSFGSRTAFGQLLVSDHVNNDILEFNLDGSFQKQLVAPIRRWFERSVGDGLRQRQRPVCGQRKHWGGAPF